MQLASSHKVPVWYEPVSAPKAPRIAKVARSFVSNESSSCTTRGLNQQSCIPPVVVYQHSTQCLRHVTFISPNIPELLALADTLRLAADLPVLPPPTHDASWSATLTALLPVLETVLEAGVQYVVLTLGAQGAALACRHPTKHSAVVFHLDALPATVVNTSGAGDCLVAATVAALVRGADPIDALAQGIAVAHVAVSTGGNVPPVLDAAAVRRDAARVAGTLQTLS